jgi:hypothetical protein
MESSVSSTVEFEVKTLRRTAANKLLDSHIARVSTASNGRTLPASLIFAFCPGLSGSFANRKFKAILDATLLKIERRSF